MMVQGGLLSWFLPLEAPRCSVTLPGKTAVMMCSVSQHQGKCHRAVTGCRYIFVTGPGAHLRQGILQAQAHVHDEGIRVQEPEVLGAGVLEGGVGQQELLPSGGPPVTVACACTLSNVRPCTSCGVVVSASAPVPVLQRRLNRIST
jgi:hypothetical protein